MAAVVSRPKPSQRELESSEMMDDDIEDADFIGVSLDGSGQIWMQSSGTITRPGVPRFTPISVSEHHSVADAVRKQIAKPHVLHKMTLAPGQYHPRIARPMDQHPHSMPMAPNFSSVDRHEIYGTARHFASLVEALDTVLETVEPSEENFSCHGNRIRNLIMLTCTECENQFRGVLRENGLVKHNDRFDTRSFALLKRPMRLDEYSVKFEEMPWLGTFAPFKRWDLEAATTSLEWYDAYNAAKHDRTKHLQRANLRTAFEALAALWILISAQYGTYTWRTQSGRERTFTCVEGPRWKMSDAYVYPYEGTGCEPQPVRLFDEPR